MFALLFCIYVKYVGIFLMLWHTNRGGAEGVMDARIGTLFSQTIPNRTGVITASRGFLFCML